MAEGLALTQYAAAPFALVWAGLVGAALGGFFFAGLWWSTQRAATAAQPALWVLASLLLRTAGVLAGFHLAGGGQWPRLLACLLGFVLARMLVLRRTRSAAAGRAATPRGAKHAAEP